MIPLEGERARTGREAGGRRRSASSRHSARPAPSRLSATEAKHLAELHAKGGEEQLAARYRAIAASLGKAERAPAPSLQQQVQSAHAAVCRKERVLQVEFAKLNKWKAELNKQKAENAKNAKPRFLGLF